ncbi:thioredoxin reductase [Desulfuribacillus stibiiarsenatis]|uniref:Thioredoxin reductase n=1 Tax=Desulfuribacillus stibiiarsenatis TaxID=1390249 RepID=A0A1E5L3Y2_9FIRM|nr:thioredoxin reductase [Desulfuribacillus stibiiarsenatis]
MQDGVYDIAIIGSGPAGATAAIYASRGKAKTIVLDKAPGTGALAITHKIANYPGQIDEVAGQELLDKLRNQAANFGANFVVTHVQGIMSNDDSKTIFTTDGILQAKSIFIAVGARGGRKNKITGEDEFLGRGVSYCATCDASFYKDKTVAVIGDNEEAIEEVMVLSKFASKMYVLIPGKVVTGNIDQESIPNNDKYDVRLNTKVKEIKGSDSVESIILENGEEVSVNGVFIYLSGNQPNTEFLNGIVETTEDGYIRVNEFMETNIPGIFAGGDIRKPPVKQAVVAAADGAIAAMSCEKYLHKKKTVAPQYG